MSRVFITGAADGLGKMAAQRLVADGHRVVVHARNAKRAADALAAVPGAEAAVFGDLASIAECRDISQQVNALGAFDAAIHNAAVGDRESRRVETVDGLSHTFAINALAPYILTALIRKPRRLVYMSSGMHHGADSSLDDLAWRKRRWNAADAYSESKLHDAILAMAVARRWRGVLSNAVDPGWVPTKMGGRGAPDDLGAGAVTQAWLATSDEMAAQVTGHYFHHRKSRAVDPAARDVATQERLIAAFAEISGVPFPD
jgi:NAD(P)-dependent dehydrogenase (short-subunit alcohol dehydrogenase family)